MTGAEWLVFLVSQLQNRYLSFLLVSLNWCYHSIRIIPGKIPHDNLCSLTLIILGAPYLLEPQYLSRFHKVQYPDTAGSLQ